MADVVAERVAAPLEIAKLAREPFALVVGAEELLQQARTGKDVLRVLDEQLEELLLAWDEGQAHERVRGPRAGALPMGTPCGRRRHRKPTRAATSLRSRLGVDLPTESCPRGAQVSSRKPPAGNSCVQRRVTRKKAPAVDAFRAWTGGGHGSLNG